MLSRGIVISGPLNTDGSFISFHNHTLDMVPLNLSYWKSVFHHDLAAGFEAVDPVRTTWPAPTIVNIVVFVVYG